MWRLRVRIGSEAGVTGTFQPSISPRARTNTMSSVSNMTVDLIKQELTQRGFPTDSLSLPGT
jgi:hypothetical protein